MMFCFEIFLTLFVLLSSTANAQFSSSCRNLVTLECLKEFPDFAVALEDRCQCDVRPAQIVPSRLFNKEATKTTPSIQCMRFSRVHADLLFRCLAQPHSLRSIDFYKETWQDLPSFVNMTNLQVLRLRDLDLRDLNPQAFFGLNRLKVLELSNNKFRQLPTGLLDGVAGLEELILHGNRLSRLERNQFAAGSTKLKRLTLSEMEFNFVPRRFFEVFPELEYLAIRRTFLTRIGHLGTLRYLRVLHLDSNRIDTIAKNAFTGLYNLKLLDLRRNWLRSFSGDLLLNQADLEDLWLADNVFACDCRLSSLMTWIKNSKYRPVSPFAPKSNRTKSRAVRLEPNPDDCIPKLRLDGNGVDKRPCGPRCEDKLPEEYFVDVPEDKLVCTTTPTTTTTTETPKPPIVTPDVQTVRLESAISEFANPLGPDSSTPFPLFSFEKFSLVLWLAIIAAASILLVLIITVIIRLRNRRNRGSSKFQPQTAHVIAVSNGKSNGNARAPIARLEEPGNKSPDSSASSSTASSNVTATDSHSSNGPLRTGQENEIAKMPQNRSNNPKLSLCFGRSPAKNRAAKMKPIARDLSSLSVAERAAVKAGVHCKADWSPLFERNGNGNPTTGGFPGNNTTATTVSGSSGYGSPLFLAVDTNSVESAQQQQRVPHASLVTTAGGVVNTKTVQSSLVDRRRPISAFANDAALLPTSHSTNFAPQRPHVISSTLYHRPTASYYRPSNVMDNNNNNNKNLVSSHSTGMAMTLNRTLATGAVSNDRGAVLFPAYKASRSIGKINTSTTPTHGSSNNNNTWSLNSSMFSSSSTNSSPCHATVITPSRTPVNANKSESLV